MFGTAHKRLLYAGLGILIGAGVGSTVWLFSFSDKNPLLENESSHRYSIVDVNIPTQPVQFSGIPLQPSNDEVNNISIYERFNEAVVNIKTVVMEYHWFLDAVPQPGVGSGSIIDNQGHILTNYHVIKDSRQINVTLASGEEREGRIIGVDPENDLAIIKISPKALNLVVIPFGRSDNLVVGQKVLAIGNPFALSGTLTTGVVSGLGRPVNVGNDIIIQEMVQTDASINPGNSGGPLLNSHGEMIGINTSIISPTGGSIGIGFAVPINTIRRVLPELIRHGEVRRGWIDMRPVQLFPRLSQQLRLETDHGILISEVIPGGNAASAGLRGGEQSVRWGRSVFKVGGDIIIEVDERPVKSISDLFNALEDNKPGDSVSVIYVRKSQRQTATIILSQRSRQVREYFY